MTVDITKMNAAGIPSHYYDVEAPENYDIEASEDEVDFEQIEKEVGVLLIKLAGDGYNTYHVYQLTLEKGWREQVKKNADTYRGWEPVIATAAKCGLQIAKIGSFMVPEDLSKQISGGADTIERLVDTVKHFLDNSVTATRIEVSADADHLKSLTEQRRQEMQKWFQELGDAIRKFEQSRNKRDDFMLSMARG